MSSPPPQAARSRCPPDPAGSNSFLKVAPSHLADLRLPDQVSWRSLSVGSSTTSIVMVPNSPARVGAVLGVCVSVRYVREPVQHPGDVGRGAPLDLVEGAPVQGAELQRLEVGPGDHLIEI